jgi:hypothetical protein
MNTSRELQSEHDDWNPEWDNDEALESLIIANSTAVLEFSVLWLLQEQVNQILYRSLRWRSPLEAE